MSGRYSGMGVSARLRRSVWALVVAGCTQGLGVSSVQAQVPVTDGAHIGMQIGQWTENVQQWIQDSQRWVSQMKSMIQEPLADLANQYANVSQDVQSTLSLNGSSQTMSMDKVIDLMASMKPCNRVTDKTAKGLCEAKQALEVARARKMALILKDIEKDLKAIQDAKNSFDSMAKQAPSLSGQGGRRIRGSWILEQPR